MTTTETRNTEIMPKQLTELKFPFQAGNNRLYTKLSLKNGTVLFKVASASNEFTRLSNEAGLVNHSDTPNCQVFNHGNDYYLIAMRDIKSGEEILANLSDLPC